MECPKCKKPGEPAGAPRLSEDEVPPYAVLMASAAEDSSRAAAVGPVYPTPDPPPTAQPFATPALVVGGITISKGIDIVRLSSFFWIGYQLGRSQTEVTSVVKRLRELLSSAAAGQL